MPAQMQGDEQLLVRFYSEINTRVNPPRDEEWVSIRTPATNDEHVFKAHTFSHTDEAGQQFTYAQRFAAHYGAFKKGDDTEARREELLKQLAALDAKAQNPSLTKAAQAAADKAALEAQQEAAPVDTGAVKAAAEALAEGVAEVVKGERMTAAQAARAKG